MGIGDKVNKLRMSIRSKFNKKIRRDMKMKYIKQSQQ